MSERVRGSVKWFDGSKGFGFLEREGEADVFVHFRGIRDDGYRTLKDGQQVEFEVIDTPKGPQANDVSIVE